jgi:hypothetical protein
LNNPGVHTYQERSLLVKPGQIVRTKYADIFSIRHASRERMASGDVDRAYQKMLQLGENSAWPCPRGYWADTATFVVVDGRHEHVASMMLGRTHILVAWVEDQP